MKIKAVKSIVMILVFIVLFSGCSLIDFFSAESLIRPPKLTGENAALQAVFEETVGKEVGLYTPIAGEYRASYIIFDANNDDNEEAIVFYSLNANKSVVHMHLLTKKDDKWVSVSDIVGSGTDVYKVDFINIDETKELEIAVMWSAEDSKREKTLSVYKISSFESENEDVLSSLATILVADYINLDFDNDSVDELLYLYFSASEDVLYSGAKLMDFDSEQNKFIPLSEITFDYQVSSYSNIINEKTESGYRIYLDCVLPDNNFATELIYYDFETDALTVPLFGDKPLSRHTLRTGVRYIDDVNDDGITDIPLLLDASPVYVFGVPAEESVSLNFIRWCYIEDGAFTEIGNYLRNETDGYNFNVNEIYADCYFSYDYQNRMLQVRGDDSFSDENILFTVSVKVEKEYSNNAASQEDSEKTDDIEERIVVSVTAFGKEKGYSQKEIRENIEIL